MPFKSNSIFPNKGCFTHGIILLTGFFALAVERFQKNILYAIREFHSFWRA